MYSMTKALDELSAATVAVFGFSSRQKNTKNPKISELWGIYRRDVADWQGSVQGLSGEM